MRKIDAQDVITFAVAAALAGITIFAIDRFLGGRADDEDRPVIIVRGGSVDLEQEQTKDWAWDSAGKKTARPDHKKGGHVIGFMVTFDATDASGNSGCPTLPVVGSSLDIEYKPQSGENEHVVIGAVLTGPKNEPVITAPKDMTLSPNKKVLSHGTAGQGSIVSVTVSYGNSATQKCTPISGKFAGEVRIKPLR